MNLSFTVYGIPIPQGSLKAFMPRGRRFPVVTSDNLRTRPWKHMVGAAAREALRDSPPLEGPVAIDIEFYLPRPTSAPKRVVYPVKKPDLDKLVRAILDACTDAGVWKDDAQVIGASAIKAFAEGNVPVLRLGDPARRDRHPDHLGIPRARIEVRSIE
jgi:crossover junction endodeoxyribonuclease RusA